VFAASGNIAHRVGDVIPAHDECMRKTRADSDRSRARKDEASHRGWREYEERQLETLVELLLDIYEEREKKEKFGSSPKGS
jgi:hypothetical protein